MSTRNSTSVRRLIAIGLAALIGLATGTTRAEDALDEIARFRQQMADDNPAELWETRGEAAWHEADGPKHVSLEQCDLGMGPGVVAGSFARLPRWFADARQVMDLEQRLVWCMMTQQGMSREAAEENHFGDGGKRSRLEALAAWIAGQSRGMPVDVPASHPEEQRMLALGERMFYYRAGRHDFSCATCHSGDKQRVRLQAVPNLTDPKDARRAWTTWPAYRISQGEVRTMQNRMNDCLRQQRMPEVGFGSELVTALSMYMAHQAQGGIVDAPSLKR
ncbi:MAG: sulfur oxidation c-type cytochrome SoxA [Pseudomonadota bacterium]|nr:sulfur oxidation c-type cytochrome SoxA [Pseudomonadota bacterium]